MVEHYIVRRRDEKAKEGTIARELEAIKRAFLLAKKTKPVKFLGEPPLIPRLKENPRSGFFTREEVDRLCRYLPHPLDKFTLFGFLTGWRKSEICRLDWANVDFRIGEFRVDTSKNGDPLVFAMTDELRDLLKSIWAPFGPVFQINGKPIKEFRKTWKTACYKAKLPCIVAPVKKGGKPGAVKVLKSLRIFHDLRRSAAREMDNQGVPRPITKSLMGHKTDQMFNRYRIVSESDKQMAIGTINGARNGAKRGMSNS
jgi:integrase